MRPGPRAARFAADAARHEMEAARAAARGPKPGSNASSTAPPGRSLREVRARRRSGGEPAGGRGGNAALEVGDPADLEIVIDVLSADAVKIRAGAEMRLGAWGGEETLRARVRRIEPSGFTKLSALGVEEQRVNVIATSRPGRARDATASRPASSSGG
jgi:HlyD family secretion protein